MRYLDTPTEMILIVQLSQAGVLVPFLEIPAAGRVKASYFIKRDPVKITRENYRDVIIPGDMAPKPIEELSVLVEEVGDYVSELDIAHGKGRGGGVRKRKGSTLIATSFFRLAGVRTDIIESEESQGLAARGRRGREEARLRFSEHNMPGAREGGVSLR